MKYFVPTPETLEALKKMYRQLALKYHSDRGGSDEDMKQVNNEYSTLFEKLKNVHVNTDGKTYHKETTETAEQFIDIINQLIRFEGILIEIIGSFVWVSKNTKPYKEELKDMGFRWSANKLSWYLAPDGYRRRNRKKYTMDDIRNMYGSQEVKNKPSLKIATN